MIHKTGPSPVDSSSGKTQRRRLNRVGDRQTNAALFRIALTRLRADPRTRAYVQRRTIEGRTKRETLRCLKRYRPRDIQDHRGLPCLHTRLTRRRGIEQAALKVLYLVIRSPRPNRADVSGTTGWKKAINTLAMYYGERITGQ